MKAPPAGPPALLLASARAGAEAPRTIAAAAAAYNGRLMPVLTPSRECVELLMMLSFFRDGERWWRLCIAAPS
jgi:hypothetical protein